MFYLIEIEQIYGNGIFNFIFLFHFLRLGGTCMGIRFKIGKNGPGTS